MHPILGLQARHVNAINMEVASTEVETDQVSNKNFTRFRKRQWEYKEKQEREENGESDTKKPCEEDKKPFERLKRKKMAMMLGYCGVDYYGMQRFVL